MLSLKASLELSWWKINLLQWGHFIGQRSILISFLRQTEHVWTNTDWSTGCKKKKKKKKKKIQQKKRKNYSIKGRKSATNQTGRGIVIPGHNFQATVENLNCKRKRTLTDGGWVTETIARPNRWAFPQWKTLVSKSVPPLIWFSLYHWDLRELKTSSLSTKSFY